MTISCLGYIGITTTHVGAWESFGTQVLGLMPAAAQDGELRFRLDNQAWRIAIAAGDADDLAYAGFEVSDKAGLDAARARLMDAGVAVRGADPAMLARRGVLDLICCEDPDGLQIEIFYGPDMTTDIPFASPAGVRSFLTGDQGLGHIFLQSKNIPRLRAFYQDALGFRLSDVIHMPLTPEAAVDLEFYHCNPRHHSVGMAPAESTRRLHHFMLEVSRLDDVGFAMDRAVAAGANVSVSLGRHSNDQVISFYVRSPCGFDVELGHGSVTIDAGWRTTRHTTPSSWGHKGLGGR